VRDARIPSATAMLDPLLVEAQIADLIRNDHLMDQLISGLEVMARLTARPG
jgi:hypothetical protein